MSESIVRMYTPAGKVVGYFKDPVVDMSPEHYYEIAGEFFVEGGEHPEKVEFNPQMLPYVADISAVKKCPHGTLQGVYVQRGRQPVRVTGSCKLD